MIKRADADSILFDGIAPSLMKPISFLRNINAIKEYKEATQELLSFVLESIGEDHGAIDVLFNRFENEVVGLPNKGKVTVGEVVFLYPNFPLRLYALRVNNRSDVVVLFNGGVKSAQTNQMSKDLHFKWMEACRFARRIEEAVRNEEIGIDSRGRIISEDGVEEIYL